MKPLLIEIVYAVHLEQMETSTNPADYPSRKPAALLIFWTNEKRCHPRIAATMPCHQFSLRGAFHVYCNPDRDGGGRTCVCRSRYTSAGRLSGDTQHPDISPGANRVWVCGRPA